MFYSKKRPNYFQSNSKFYSNKKQKSRSHGNCSDSESENEKEREKEEGIGLGSLNALHTKVDCIGNHIWFNDDVENESVSKLIKIISAKNFIFNQKVKEIYFGKIEPVPIYLHINSDGGSISDAMAAVDCIRNSKIPIYTIIEGNAASAATFLSIAGKKRFITENSVLLIHQLSSGMWGTMSQLEDEHQNNKFFMEKIYSIYNKYTKISRRRLEKILKHDIWWDATKAIKYGFVDQIYKGEDESNQVEIIEISDEE
jgi:ATP-dependent Clp endopeptidase proteolytic subunit ClpP